MARRCSHCGNNGHNSRTCPDRGVRLFGVRLTNNAMRKTVSMGNLSHYGSNGAGSGAGAGSPNTGGSTPEHSESGAEGYVSDGLVQTSSNDRERKKGVPWTEDEHRLFLIGLQKLGKGDWRGISRNFVTSRTPTQVASHAQKYFIRQSNLSKRKRRSSLFDISAEISNSAMEDASLRFSDLPTSPLHQLTLGHAFTEGFSKPPTIPTSKALDMADPAHKTEAESMEIDSAIHPLWLGLPQIPFGRPANPSPPPNSNIFKPTAKLSTAAIRLEDSSDLTQLSLGICPTQGLNSSKINLKLDQSSRQSAFHLNSSFGSGSVASNEGLNKAISVV